MAQSTYEQAAFLTGDKAAAAPRVRQEEVIERGSVDVIMLTVVMMLVGIGMLGVYSGSAIGAYFQGSGDDLMFLRRQAMGAVAGLVMMIIASRIDYSFYRRNIYWFLGVGFAALVLTAVPGIGTTVKGATRWITIAGIRFQPAELVKLVTVMYLAYSITKKGATMSRLLESFIFHGLIFFPFIALLMHQPDFGSSAIICAMVGAMLFVGGARGSYMIGFVSLGAVMVYSAIQSASYRQDRVTAWLDPWADAGDTGYQLVNSYVALANGGLTGTGFGEGRGRLGFIPELFNDFIAAAIGEEFGLIGMCTLAILYTVFIWRGMTIAFKARDAFGAYLAFGLTTLIGLQAGINLCVVTGLLPTKGLTLPFVSYGRSSLVLLLFAVGILMNISQRNPDVRLESEEDRQRDVMENDLNDKQVRMRQRRRTRQLKAVDPNG